MLGEGGPDFIRITVELQHSLRLAAVGETIICEELAGAGARLERCGSEDLRAVEGELLEIVGKLSCRGVFALKAREDVLEHS